MEDFITHETFISINKLCVYIVFFVANTIFLGRFFAELLWHKYILKAATFGRFDVDYNPFIYIPLIIIALMCTVIPVIFHFDDMYGKDQNIAINGYFQFLIIFLIPSFISLFFIRFKKEFVTQTYYKLNFKILELKIIKFIFISTALIICFVPTIFSLMKVDLSGPKVDLLGPILLIVIFFPMIELTISSINFLNQSIEVQKILNFKFQKMKEIEKITNTNIEYSESYFPLVDLRSYLVIKHGWDLIYMHPNDDLFVTKYGIETRSKIGVKDEYRFEIHNNIRDLFPKAAWSAKNQEFNPKMHIPSTLVSEVLKVNKKIMFSSSIPGDRDNIFKRFMTQTLKKLYIIVRHNNNDFEIQEVEYNLDKTENLDNYKMLSLEYDILTIPNYLQLSLKDK